MKRVTLEILIDIPEFSYTMLDDVIANALNDYELDVHQVFIVKIEDS